MEALVAPAALAGFAVLWCGIGALLAVFSGWTELAERFRARGRLRGQPFRYESAQMGAIRWFPVRYAGCLHVTVGDEALGLALFPLFRTLSPPLCVPWTEIVTVQVKPGLFGSRAELRIRRSAVVITLFGAVADAVAAAHAKAHFG